MAVELAARRLGEKGYKLHPFHVSLGSDLINSETIKQNAGFETKT